MNTTLNFPTTVDELRTALLEAGDDPVTVAAMKKTELKQRFVKLTTDEINFELESLNEASPVETLEDAIGVVYGSNQWQDYVLGLFKPDELVDGYPKINGLRRVANYVLGDIISSKATQVFVTMGDNKSVTVNYEIQIEWKLNTPIGFGNMGHIPQVRIFGGLADCNEDLSSAYGKHSSATAESKAEGRALRKALALNVIAAEEMLTGSIEDGSPKAKPTSPITKPLQDVILVKVKALQLDLEKIIVEWAGSKRELSSFTVQEGREFFEHINSFQQTKKV